MRLVLLTINNSHGVDVYAQFLCFKLYADYKRKPTSTP